MAIRMNVLSFAMNARIWRRTCYMRVQWHVMIIPSQRPKAGVDYTV